MHIHVAAVLKLQAGFRPEYADDFMDLPFFDSLKQALKEDISELCWTLKVKREDMKTWENALFAEIETVLNRYIEGDEIHPFTGDIDLQQARMSLKQWHQKLVFTRKGR